jgi:hypothetical protein
MRARRKRFLRGKVLEYDPSSRRLWIGGQRCHHGAAGSIVATTAAGSLLTGRPGTPSRPRPLMALILAGWALMAHDWKDRSIWFERGRGSQRS